MHFQPNSIKNELKMDTECWKSGSCCRKGLRSFCKLDFYLVVKIGSVLESTVNAVKAD